MGEDPREPRTPVPKKSSRAETAKLGLGSRSVHAGEEDSNPYDAITQPIVHIWGIRGVGKSWLLHHLRAQYGFAAEKGIRKKEGLLKKEMGYFKFVPLRGEFGFD